MKKLLIALVIALFFVGEIPLYIWNLDPHHRTSLNCLNETMGGTVVSREHHHIDPVPFEGQIVMVEGIDTYSETVGGFPLRMCSFR